jgi:hypothetical protein
MRGEDRDPRSPYFSCRAAAGQVKYEVEIVNHQVQHHGDVGPTGLERGQSQALDITWALQIRLGRPEGPVVPFDMSHLQLHLLTVCCRDQPIGLGQGSRQWLLHQYGHAKLESAQSDFGMSGSGHCDRYGLDSR